MRALLLVLDSVGCGAAPDAARYGDPAIGGDAGANTLGHIFERCPDLRLPTLDSIGLNRVLSNAEAPQGALCGRMRPASSGKDTTTGHWELAGVVLSEPFATYSQFPPELVEALEAACGTTFIGNVARSGTEILNELGEEHLRTGLPILYTSADSVIQIAAHEERFGLERLYEVCKAARKVADTWQIGRVIARPFVGELGNFQRTSNRHDYSLVPPRTILNALQDAGIPTTGVGKISDIFAGSGIGISHPTKSNRDGMETLERLWPAFESGLVFANLVDFDTLYGHRRDVKGYAQCLREFDAWLATFLPLLRPDDLLIVTADHGNDPAHPGTDHTREEVPLLVRYGDTNGWLGTRQTFADVAATLAQLFSLEAPTVGTSFLED